MHKWVAVFLRLVEHGFEALPVGHDRFPYDGDVLAGVSADLNGMSQEPIVFVCPLHLRLRAVTVLTGTSPGLLHSTTKGRGS